MTQTWRYPLPWQLGQWQQLQQRWQQQRFPHALLLAGEHGLGQLGFAHTLAQTILCQSVNKNTNAEQAWLACGTCQACQWVKAGSHSDYSLLQPEETGKAIKVDQVRACATFLRQTSQQGGYRVVVIEPAEAMNRAAANALLKCLEEPGAATLLMLVTYQPNSLIATIRSRCQTLKFAAPRSDIAQEWLQAQLQHDEAVTAVDAKQLLNITHHAPLAALEFARSDRLQAYQRLLDDLCELLAGTMDACTLAEKWHKDNLAFFIDCLQMCLIDLIRYTNALFLQYNQPQAIQRLLQSLGPRHNVHTLFALWQQLLDAKRLLNSATNPNTQLLLEGLLIGLLK